MNITLGVILLIQMQGIGELHLVQYCIESNVREQSTPCCICVDAQEGYTMPVLFIAESRHGVGSSLLSLRQHSQENKQEKKQDGGL